MFLTYWHEIKISFVDSYSDCFGQRDGGSVIFSVTFQTKKVAQYHRVKEGCQEENTVMGGHQNLIWSSFSKGKNDNTSVRREQMTPIP